MSEATLSSMEDQARGLLATVEGLLPPVLFEVSLLSVQLWQWLGLLALIVVAWILSWMMILTLRRVLVPLARRSRGRTDDHVLAAVAGPARLALAVGLFATFSRLLRLAAPAQGFVDQLGRILIIIALSWMASRIVDLVGALVEEHLVERGQANAKSLLPLGRRVVKAVVFGLTAIVIMQGLGFNVAAILAGLGVGGLAVALAAQKTLENLFGGLSLIGDQPVRVGDFCRFGDRVGTVEDIGLRSTRVRTLERTVVSVPNSQFAAMELENFARRDRVWFHHTIGLRYETGADQMRHVLIALKEMLASHPKVHPDPARVRFVQFGACSLDLEIFAYVLTSDINEYLAVQEDLLLRIMDIVDAAGTGFAFPSQTTYLAHDSGLDTERGRAAEAQVQQWREQNALGLPAFPAQHLTRLAGTLDYPPRGSAVGNQGNDRSVPDGSSPARG